jgi:hypothetical protein
MKLLVLPLMFLLSAPPYALALAISPMTFMVSTSKIARIPTRFHGANTNVLMSA